MLGHDIVKAGTLAVFYFAFWRGQFGIFQKNFGHELPRSDK
ncbi:hypothetical protein RRSWK_06674 [Rhodopirellula sp. SWK7]|nr:hypothetical protein RRSWK_06674 [Rhodopirellula sp. SWK7]